MELYFQNLISKEATLEKLVDDLTLVVQGADDYARALGAELPEQSRQELTSRLNHLKEACRRLKTQAVSGAVATDKLLRANPYVSLGVAFACGLLIGGKVLCRK